MTTTQKRTRTATLHKDCLLHRYFLSRATRFTRYCPETLLKQSTPYFQEALTSFTSKKTEYAKTLCSLKASNFTRWDVCEERSLQV